MRLALVLRARKDEIADATLARVRQELPDYDEVMNPDFQAAGYGALPAVLAAAWTTLESDGRCPEHLPSPLVEEALNAARAGVSWDVVDRSYSMTHEAIWDVALDEISSWQLTHADQTLVLRVASKFLFRCFEWLTTKAGEVYAGERDEWLDRRQKRLLELVSQVIDGLAVPDTELGYGTQQQHLGVISWGRDPHRAISDSARALGGELLSVPSTGSAVWAWLGRPRFPDYAECISAFTPGPGTHVALGAISGGREGFTRTHQQAQLASWVAARQFAAAARSVTAYPEVAVEAVALADDARARMFVGDVLGPLATNDTKHARLRQTLRAYCDVGQNSAAAAQRLNIAERTVRYRLRALEDTLGDRFSTGLLEPWLAVRLFEALEREANGRFSQSPDRDPGGHGD
jgi:hypothetical protein